MDAVTNAALVEANSLSRHFTAGSGTVRAVDDVDFRLQHGETVGLLGESGSGKTTTGRLLLRLMPPSSGEVRFDGADISPLRGQAMKRFRTRAQLVFQNPYDALNPRFTLRQSLSEPLINAQVPRVQRPERIASVMRQVRLPSDAATLAKYPHQMSGGQLQRVVLARALILRPDFIVADEPVSMLDVSVRAGILNLLRDIHRDMGLTGLYISHDVTLVRYICVRTMVMYRGRIVEDGPTADVIRDPLHPYTKALIAAVPVPRVEQNRAPIPLRHRRSEPVDPAVGCGFRDRCPHVFERCFVERPALRPAAARHSAACHLHA